eukprot:TRINITY_DN17592_c0_g1_i1.p1 TRINITY_DN17592_c0_g1~~TRINITY_DN17592_c0_g1_i1.p1  ORF type:complete len:254 (+),score=77.28 TRINITY_DN17592_c0_g1_i1:173-934(+)
MGLQCSQDREKDKTLDVPYYEYICSKMEKRLILPTLSLRQLLFEIRTIERAQGLFASDGIISIYQNHGVSKQTFLAPNSIYQELLPDYDECDLCSQYLLSTALPFCDGSIVDKKDILWQILQPEEGRAERKVLKNTVKMIIALCVKTIPEIAVKDLETRGEVLEDADMQLLLQSDDLSVERYANRFFLEQLKGISEDYTAEEASKELTRYEYDLWMLKINEEKLLSSKGNRELFIKYVKSLPEEERKYKCCAF